MSTAVVVSPPLFSTQPRRADRSGPVKGPTPSGARPAPPSQPPVLFLWADLPCSVSIRSAAFRSSAASCSLDQCPTDLRVKQTNLARARTDRSAASGFTYPRGGHFASPSSTPLMPPDVVRRGLLRVPNQVSALLFRLCPSPGLLPLRRQCTSGVLPVRRARRRTTSGPSCPTRESPASGLVSLSAPTARHPRQQRHRSASPSYFTHLLSRGAQLRPPIRSRIAGGYLKREHSQELR